MANTITNLQKAHNCPPPKNNKSCLPPNTLGDSVPSKQSVSQLTTF